MGKRGKQRGGFVQPNPYDWNSFNRDDRGQRGGIVQPDPYLVNRYQRGAGTHSVEQEGRPGQIQRRKSKQRLDNVTRTKKVVLKKKKRSKTSKALQRIQKMYNKFTTFGRKKVKPKLTSLYKKTKNTIFGSKKRRKLSSKHNQKGGNTPLIEYKYYQ